MFPHDRDLLRKFYFDAWQKHKNNLLLEPLEKQLVALIAMHPEYQPLFENEQELKKEFFLSEQSPFLHLSLHQALNEQISTNRPHGITAIYHDLMKKYQNDHEVQHRMMAVLAEEMHRMLHAAGDYDERQYLEKLKIL